MLSLDAFPVPAVAAALAAAAIALGLRGVDWSAQIYRVSLFRAHGFLGFDAGWYGGHAPLAYSVIFPALAATLTVPVVVVVSATVAAWAFDKLVRMHLGPQARAGSVVFAAATVVEVVVGELPFLLALAFGLLCILALSSGRRSWAIAAAVACALTNGVAAGFLVLAVVAWAVAGSPSRRLRCLAVAVAALTPVALLSIAYRQGGSFPFRFSGLAFILGLCAIAAFAVPRRAGVLRVGALLYALASVAAFVVPSPMGGNMGRLGTAIGIPLVVAVSWPVRKVLLALIALPLLGWQWGPGLSAVTSGRSDASRKASYFAPLLTEVAALDHAPARIEIPPTRDHWEVAWVAPTSPLARGWERQLDIHYDALFYDTTTLAADAYHRWLEDNGVTLVALPDVPLDYGARSEGALLASPPSWLVPVWSSAHWTVWRVDGSPGLVSGPAVLTALSADTFTLNASQAADILVRVRYSPTWTIDGGGACLVPAPGGWTDVRVTRPGPVEVTAGLLPRSSASC